MSDRSGRPARRPRDPGTPPRRGRSRAPSRPAAGPSWRFRLFAGFPDVRRLLWLRFVGLRLFRLWHVSRVCARCPVRGPANAARGSSVPYMRLGVLDVGSNTVHLLVVDAHPGARPLPAHSHKADLRLAQLLDDDGAIGPEGVDRLVARRPRRDGGRRGQGRGGPAAVRHLRRPRGQQRRPGPRPRQGGDRRRPAGPHRRRGGPADLPRRPPLVRLVGGQAAGPRHRRRLPGDRVRHRRGAGRGGLACRSARAGSPPPGCPATRRTPPT